MNALTWRLQLVGNHNLICLNGPSSQNMEEFELFVKNLELNLEITF